MTTATSEKRLRISPPVHEPHAAAAPPAAPAATPHTARKTLEHCGHVYVTRAATVRFMQFTGMQFEAARRVLTEELLDAHFVELGPPTLFRARSSRTGRDISARVTMAGRLAVVVSIHVREYYRLTGA